MIDRLHFIFFICVVMLFSMGRNTAWSADKAEVPEEAAEMEQQFLVAEKKLQAPLRRLDENYIKHLEALLKQKQIKGNLEGALEVAEELKGVKNGNFVVSKVKNLDLDHSKKTYFRARQRTLKNEAPQHLRLLKAYKSHLLELATSLTKAGKLEEAVRVQVYARSLDAALLVQEKRGSFAEPLRYGKANWDYIEDAIKREKLDKVSYGGESQDNYYDLGDKTRILVGFRFALNDFGGYRIVRGLQAVFRGRDSKDVISEVSLGTKKPLEHKKVVAKEGYAVGAIEVRTAPFIRQVRIHFYRVISERLDPDDNYSSSWYGKWGKTFQQDRVDAGERIPVGIHGKYGLGMDKLGLVLISREAG